MQAYDAIVIGAGPAGSTTALLLARAGWSVAVVEKSPFPRAKVCGEFISAPALGLFAELDLGAHVLAEAGPPVREVGVYAGNTIALSAMPAAEGPVAYGRAVGRDFLDSLLLDAACRAGSTLYQPFRVHACQREALHHVCRIASGSGHREQEIAAPVLIAAHGSADTGGLPLAADAQGRASDLLSFKAHFLRSSLPRGRMSLVAFPGGYGGLVQSNGERVSFSCCIRRDALAECRARAPGASAGAAVLQHVLESCRGAREALGAVHGDEHWLGAPPVRPGIRCGCGEGRFAVGNAMGEAHPIIAEGISMAIQSAWLLCSRLIAARGRATGVDWNAIGRDYENAYRRAFGARIKAASIFAALAMRPAAACSAAAVLAGLPRLVSYGARCAGKIRTLPAGA